MNESTVTGQAFKPEEGITIGKLDSAGKLWLVVDPATLQPDLAEKLHQCHRLGSERESVLELSESRYSSSQT